MSSRRNDNLFLWGEIARSVATFFAAIFLVFSHFIEVIVFRAKGTLLDQQNRRDKIRLDADIETLVQSLKLRAAAANFPTNQSELTDALVDEFTSYDLGHKNLPCKSIYNAYFNLAWQFFKDEQFVDVRPLTSRDEVEKGRYADYLIAHRRKLDDAAKTLAEFYNAIAQSFVRFAKHLPTSAFTMNSEGEDRGSIGAIPILDELIDLPDLVIDIMIPLHEDGARDTGLFKTFRGQLDANDARAGGTLPAPEDFRGTSLQLVDAYTGGTPFRKLFDTYIPFDFADRLGEHAVIVAPSGVGKTQFIQALTLHLLHDPSPPSIIILNSQGKMLDKIQRLGLFAPGQPLSDRLVIIDPEDESAPAMNVFSLPTNRVNAYSRNIREQVEAGTTETMLYLFSSLASELTGKQATAFLYLISLVVSIKGATFDTLRQILEDDAKGLSDSPFGDDILKLDDVAQNFFKKQYFSSEFKTTRLQVGRRLYQVLKVPAFARMFGSSDNKIDFFSLMQKGSIILVNTSKNLLGDDASSLFGRYIVSCVLRAAFERVAVANPRRTLLLIDEASDYVDGSFEKILSKVRQFNVGCLMAFQDTGQIPIMNSVLANTAVRLFAGDQYHDASILSRAMRSSPDFLISMRQSKTHTQFATYVRGMPAAVRMAIRLGALEAAPRMTDEQHAELLQRNRQRYSAAATAAQPAKPAKNKLPETDKEW